MAPRILMLLRSPVTGISGGCPTRLQVACSVESCRKLASSVKISARLWVRAFFKVGIGAPMPAVLRSSIGARQDAAGALHREAHLVQQLPHVSRMVGDAEFLTQSPRRASAKSRFPCPNHRPPGHFRGYPRVGRVAPLSDSMDDPIGSPPATHPRRVFDKGIATPTPWISAPSESKPIHRSCGLRS